MTTEIRPLNIERIKIPLIGESSLILHAWSEKAKKMILDKQMKKAAAGKEAKNPEQDVLNCFYPPADDETSLYGFPAVAFKAAFVAAARTFAGLKMTELRAAMHITCEHVPIYGAWAPREDMVRVSNGVADIRYRPEFAQWGTVLPVAFNAGYMSREQVANLFQSAGFSCGVGEWRPERNGAHGMFRVGDMSEIEALVDITTDTRNAA